MSKGTDIIEIKSDLTVIGAGIAGLCAAVSAARKGLTVSLLNDRTVLGGNNSSECRVHMSSGASAGNPSCYVRETGIVDELKLRIFHQNPRYESKKDFDLTDMAFFQFVHEQENIFLFTSTAAYDAETVDGKIKGVLAYNSRTETTYRFVSAYYCDASGDGLVSFKAGAECRMGREGKDEYNESLAPEVGDEHTMGCCLMYTTAKADHPIKFTRPPFAYDYSKPEIYNKIVHPDAGKYFADKAENICSVWWMSYGGLLNTIKDEDEIYLELKKLVYGFWDHFKNSGKWENSEYYYIDWMAPFAAKRESRRVMGDYVLNENDILNIKEFEDAVATASWPIDVHDVNGIYGDVFPTTWKPLRTYYNLPFKMMYSKDIDNLFLAGRIVSSSHVAMGSFRVMQTLGAMAQAVGEAAAICKDNGIMPRQLANDKKYVQMLQENLQKTGQFIVGKKESIGLFEGATVTSSAIRKLENTACDRLTVLEKPYLQGLPIKDDTFSGVELYFDNSDSVSHTQICEIYESELPGAYNPDRLLETVNLEVPARFSGFIKLNCDCRGIKNNKVVIKFNENEFVKIGASKSRFVGAPALLMLPNELKLYRDMPKNDDGGVLNNAYCICFKGLDNAANVYAAENVINGYSRPYINPNIWSSDSDDAYLELTLTKPSDIKEIHIALNAELDSDHFAEDIETLFKDYDIIVTTKNGKVTKQVRDNYLGYNIIEIGEKDVVSVKICNIKTYGSKFKEIYTVKAF